MRATTHRINEALTDSCGAPEADTVVLVAPADSAAAVEVLDELEVAVLLVLLVVVDPQDEAVEFLVANPENKSVT